MKESTRNEIVRWHYGGASQRRIAKLLGVARKSVARVLAGHQQHRAETVEVERPRRPSVLDPFVATLPRDIGPAKPVAGDRAKPRPRSAG